MYNQIRSNLGVRKYFGHYSDSQKPRLTARKYSRQSQYHKHRIIFLKSQHLNNFQCSQSKKSIFQLGNSNQELGIEFIIQFKVTHIQKMSDLPQNDEHFMNKLQQIVPELRKEIEASMRGRLNSQLDKAKQDKRIEINERYQVKIKRKIQQSNQALKRQLATIVEKIQKIKRDLTNQKPKRLSQQEEQELVEQTVEQILGDQGMLEEVKARLRPRLEGRVKAALERELQEGIEAMKQELQEKMNEEREAWTQERIQFWTRQSQLELNQLAAQHKELSTKKQNLQTVLNCKKMEKRQAEKKWESVTEKNALVNSLRAELKRLRQMR